ncbi:scavenger receptor class B member 1 isoform X2 [Anabrus simplex]
MRFRLFNYTNVREFKAGDETKLRVEEIGPYTFLEQSERVNIVFGDNGTITYQDKRTYEFVPELSNGSLNDTVFTVNMPLMTAYYKERKMNVFRRLAISGLLNVMKPEPFHKKTVQQIFWGYEDSLIKMASIGNKEVRVGLLQQKNGTSKNTITVSSGAGDLNQLGQITRFDGKDSVNYYASDECNRVDGSDGTKFPPPQVVPGGTLYIYHRDVCRRVPLDYEKDVQVWDGVPALRFRPPKNVLDDGDANPDNACYCLEDSYDVCQPSGVMGTSHCKNNVPIYASFPHFYLGDPILLDAVDGLKPDPEKHDMYLDIHKMGVPVAGRTRFQFNVLVKNSLNNYVLASLDDRLLPIVWLERELGDFPPEIKKLLYTVSFTVPQIKKALEYGTVITAVITGVALLVWLAVVLHSLLRPVTQIPEVYVMTRL